MKLGSSPSELCAAGVALGYPACMELTGPTRGCSALGGSLFANECGIDSFQHPAWRSEKDLSLRVR